MHVCLVNVPSPFLLDDRVFPPLGLLQVATALENSGHDVYVEDLGGVSDYKEVMAKTASLSWDCYGVTATTPQYPTAVEVLNIIRENDPGKRVIIGGPHATVMPESCDIFDCVVMGDGENAILDAILDGAPRRIDMASNVTKGILNYVLPARHLIDLDSYKYKLHGAKGTSVLTESGCPFACSFCNTYGTQILTDAGVLPIGEVVSGKAKHVWTRLGLKKISKRFKHRYSGDMLKVKIVGGRSIEATPDHEFLTRRGWIPAGELVWGDEVRVSVPEDDLVNDVQSIDLFLLLSDIQVSNRSVGKYSRYNVEEVKRLIVAGWSNNKICKETRMKRDTIARIRSGAYFRRGGITAIQECPGGIRFKHGKKTTKRHLVIDHKFMRLAGLFVAEGHVHFLKSRPNSGEVAWTFGYHEEHLVNETVDLIRDVMGESVCVTELESTYQIHVGNSVFAHTFSRLFGKGAEFKKFPWEWLFLPKDLMFSFLGGYLEGDGTYSKDPDHGQGRWRATTTSLLLARQLQILFARFGKASGVYLKKGTGGKQIIQGREVDTELAYSVEMSGKLGIESARLWASVVSVDRETFSGEVYNLEVEDLPNFSAAGVDIHNCCGRSNNFYRRVRVREPNEFVRELELLQERWGINAAMDFSDEINLLTEPLIKLCKAVKPLGMKFRAFVKANIFDDRQAEAMAEAGFVELNTGVESGDNRILGIIDKKTTRDINKRFVDLCKKHGMRNKAFMSLSQAGETHESAMNTKEWLLWAKPDDFDITIVSVYPATPYWDNREHVGVNEAGQRICKYVKKSKIPSENGATLFFEEVDYSKSFSWYKGKPGAYVSHTWTPDLSKEDLVKLRDQIEDDVRKELNIPYPKRYSGDFLHENEESGQNFDHSMGQGLSPQDSRVARKE